jgi:hypothetical protein
MHGKLRHDGARRGNGKRRGFPGRGGFGLPAPPASCYAPHVFQVADGIQPLLNRGIDGRGETVTVLEPGPSSAAPVTLPPGVTPSPGQAPPASTDIARI